MNNKKSWAKLSIFAIFAVLMGLSSIANADNAESMTKLSVLKAAVENRGVNCRGRARGSYLNQGGYYVLTTTLYRGNEYFIIAAGDSNVDDLDIVLLDEYGNEYDRDTKMDAVPMVEASIGTTGTYRVAVVMQSGSGHSNIMVCFR
jgi:hypothetical protein